ncbi:MAG: TolC family outer membrane protein [Alphaproteobacteria bacterium]|nr:TolC family outer membrane protein [Alphaproteobacteria bacterium]
MTATYSRRLALTLVALGLGTAPAAAETLQDALTAAYLNNPVLEAQRASVRAEDENVSQALSGYRPSLSASGSVTTERTNNFFSQTGGKQTLNPIQATVALEQPLFSSFRTYNAVKEAKTEVSAARSGLVSTEQQVLLDTVSAYMDVLRDEAVLDLRRNNVQVLQKQLQASKDRFEVGEITRTDVAQSEARLSAAISGRIAAEADLAASRAAYERIVGNAPGTLEQPTALAGVPNSEDRALQLALDSNPDLQQARLQEEAARRAIDRAKSDLGPEISLVAQYQYSEDQFISGFTSKTTALMAKATVPLYQSGVVSSRIRQAKQVDSERRMQAIEAERQVREAVRNAWERLRAARATIDASKSQVDASNSALDGVRQELEVGSRTTLDVLDAEQEYLDAQVQLVRAHRDEFVAAFQLLVATGQATAQSLQLPVEYYDPTEYYQRSTGKWFGWGTGD